MPAKPKTSGSWSEKQPRYVEIPPMNQDVRPQLGKMISCDLSVEESFTTNYICEQDIIKATCGFPKKPVRDRYPPFSPISWFGFPNNEEAVATYKKIGNERTSCHGDPSSFKADPEEKQAKLIKLGFQSTIWKVGAVESEKSRSPTEHDENENVDSEQDENPSFLEECKTHTCTENLKVEVQSKVRELPSSTITTICDNPFQVKRKSTAKKKKCKSPLKRQSIGKKKRNKWVILCDEEPLKPARQKKVTVSNKTCTVKVNKKHHSTSQCKDSGVSSGSSYDSGSASSGDSGSQDYDGKNGGGGEGGGGGGGSSFRRNGGMGGAGRGDDSDEKRPFSSGDTEMKDEEDTEDDGKKKSKGSSDMDCEDDSLEQHSVEWQSLPFQTQHLQHSCYCSKDGNCDRPLCIQMKRELKHLKEKLSEDCARCQKIVNLLKLHAATCQRPGCRVPNCPGLRARKEAQPPQVAKDQYKNFHKSIPSHIPPSTDGQVLYWKLPLCGGFFQENINYCKGKLLGNGANGIVYEVHLPPAWRQKPMVVKETNYPYNREELEVYKSMGSHENIVDHYCVTIKGCEYKMAVFMEKCDKSLKDICEMHAMDTKEVMFYWTQVLAAVDHLHDKGIIHKDIKAKNILLSERPGQGENCRAKLADFDSAKKLETEFTQSGLRPMGTRGFVAPEVLEQKPHGRPADVYSMGCLLLELHGITPKQDELPQQVNQLYSKDPYQGQLVHHCVQQDHCNRPTIKQLINLPYVQGFLRVPDQL